MYDDVFLIKIFLKYYYFIFFVGYGSVLILLYNGGLYLIFLYIIKFIFIKIKRIDINCVILILFVSIKLFVCNFFIKNWLIEY